MLRKKSALAESHRARLEIDAGVAAAEQAAEKTVAAREAAERFRLQGRWDEAEDAEGTAAAMQEVRETYSIMLQTTSCSFCGVRSIGSGSVK
eukprot:scaffold165975_cov36-Prasinocladus_malaysianus.AAC.1